MVRYRFAGAPDSSAVTLRVLESDGSVLESYTAKSRSLKLPIKAGLNEWAWDLKYPDAERFDGLIMWAGRTDGPRAVPGTYGIRLVVGEDSSEVAAELLPDPRATATPEALTEQFEFLIAVRDKLTETHEGIKNIRSIRDQVKDVQRRLKNQTDAEEIEEAGKALLEELKSIEEMLYQTKNRSGQDPLNFPIKLNNRLAALAGNVASGDHAPTEQAYRVRDQLTAAIDAELDRLQTVMNEDLPRFNDLVAARSIPAVLVANE